jgi:CDP-diacylglycerol--glycerol-3-phosphate 3-phosphatidyltransferase
MLIEFKYHNFLAAAVFIIAASTDSLDGYIARKRNLITNFGKFIDPLADKLLVTSALIVLVSKGQVPALVAIIIISREFIITGFRLLASSEGVVLAASWLGKVKTVTQIVAIIAIIIGNFPFTYINFPFDIIVLYISVIFTVISAVDYIYKNRKLVKED